MTAGEVQTLNVVIKADVRGSLEALQSSLSDLGNDEVKVNVVEHVKKMIEDFPGEDDIAAIAPAALHLFNVRDDGEKLPEDKAVSFHDGVARGVFVCEHATPDIQPAVAFLTTRASQPDEDDWKKLRRMIDCLKGTPNRILTPSSCAKEKEKRASGREFVDIMHDDCYDLPPARAIHLSCITYCH